MFSISVRYHFFSPLKHTKDLECLDFSTWKSLWKIDASDFVWIFDLECSLNLPYTQEGLACNTRDVILAFPQEICFRLVGKDMLESVGDIIGHWPSVGERCKVEAHQRSWVLATYVSRNVRAVWHWPVRGDKFLHESEQDLDGEIAAEHDVRLEIYHEDLAAFDVYSGKKPDLILLGNQ